MFDPQPSRHLMHQLVDEVAPIVGDDLFRNSVSRDDPDDCLNRVFTGRCTAEKLNLWPFREVILNGFVCSRKPDKRRYACGGRHTSLASRSRAMRFFMASNRSDVGTSNTGPCSWCFDTTLTSPSSTPSRVRRQHTGPGPPWSGQDGTGGNRLWPQGGLESASTSVCSFPGR
ncbi:unnamed protein product [Vitrella brassicaformis CCMP3155]|uniref:Uncharacterized protein n=1 Tax=Vitrella brassicaformis (strain CCMP3155) TaxID=1169540 RepID=A0A0G4F199_VITBC|nr:unnamed protein product [Vitrella brassicaformis CCMP3155]|eukprot:CEM05485.1 unnamed protein product [Vitrella brassicaformis CCMP3155]